MNACRSKPYLYSKSTWCSRYRKSWYKTPLSCYYCTNKSWALPLQQASFLPLEEIQLQRNVQMSTIYIAASMKNKKAPEADTRTTKGNS